MNFRAGLLLLSVLSPLALVDSAVAQEVVLRHALDGRALDALATRVIRFNDEQKGKTRVVLEDARSIEDKKNPPHLALLDAEEDAQAFFETRPRFKPLHQLMRETNEKFDASRFFPQIADAVDDLTGKIQALPVAMSLPVLLYNKEAFVKARLDPEVPPKTWWEVQQAAGALFDAGYRCPLTSSHFVRMHFENLASQHGESVFVKSGKGERMTINTLVNVKHLALLTSWHKSFYFHYFGPGREGEAKFASGECAMLTGESSVHATLANARFSVGVGDFPHYDDVYGAAPVNVLPDGMALWVLPGKKKDEYKAAARFVGYLLRPEVQKEWVRATGFLPMMPVALDALRAAGATPAVLDVSARRLSVKKKGEGRMRLGPGQGRLRDMINEEIDFVWQNLKPPKEALDTAVRRSASLLMPSAQAATPQ